MSGGKFNAQLLANAFVQQYYSFLHGCPKEVHKFYRDSSLLGWPGTDDAVASVTTLEGINAKIISSDHKEWPVEIKTVDAQESMNGGVIVVVTGCFTKEGNTKMNFCHTFFLAKQERGYFVLNDILRLIDVCERLPNVGGHVTESHEAAPTHDSEPANISDHPVQESESTETKTKVREHNVNEASIPSVASDTAAGIAVSKLSVSSLGNVHPVVDMPVAGKDDSLKISYASMVSKASSATSPTHAYATRTIRVSAFDDQQPVVSPVPKAPTSVENASRSSSTSDVASKVSTPHARAMNATYAEAKGIYIGGLPYNITKRELVEVLEQFGEVKRISDYVQIRRHEDGFCCGFVEFVSSDSADRAVKAHYITCGDKEAYVTYKKSSYRGGNREGFTAPARGDYQNGNFRGRETVEGKNRRFQNGNQTGFRRGISRDSGRGLDADKRTHKNMAEQVASKAVLN